MNKDGSFLLLNQSPYLENLYLPTLNFTLQYTSHGAISAMKLGNGLWEHTSFNSRLQPTLIGLGTSSTDSSKLALGYAYGTTDNNGNVQSQTITAPNLTLTQSYHYDALNRLSQAQEMSGTTTVWTQGFGYDRFGNRTFAAPTTIPAQPPDSTISPATNRLTDHSYDAAGNVTSEPQQAHLYTYDGENRIASVNSNTDAYGYDGDGRRVKKVTATETTIFVYNASGVMVAEYSTATPTGAGGTSYLTSDTLGTPRIITDASGGVKSRHDYLPFGEELFVGTSGRTTAQGYVGSADGVRNRFTGKERDDETGLDYFINRYYSSAQGRFTSADPVPMTSQRPADPQRLNLYAYVRNNPLTYTDPNGLDLYFELNFDAKGKATNLDDAKKYRKYVEKATGLKLKLDEKTGQITIKSEPKSLTGVATQIKTIINDSSAPIRIGASNNDANVLGGRFDGGGHQTLDFGDINKLSKKGGFTKESIVTHETTEAYEGRNTARGDSLQPAFHNTAIGFENDVRAQQGRGARIGESGTSSGTEDTYVIDFTTHTETIVTDAGTGTIKSVKVEKKKP